MIKFFRKIRLNLLREGKTGKYLKYAMGEIVLVVIGILIALQINNWNEDRKEFKKSKALLEEFKKDLELDTLESNYVTGKLAHQLKIESWALQLISYKHHHLDSLRKVYFGTYYQQPISIRTYSKLQNSENPNLTGFQELQNDLTKYYTQTKYLLDTYNEEEKQKAFESELNDHIRSKLEMNLSEFPMLPQDNDSVDDFIQFAQSIQGRNYIKANFKRRTGMLRYFRKVKEEAKLLIQKIDVTLEAYN